MRLVNTSIIFPSFPESSRAFEFWKTESVEQGVRLIAVGDIGFSGGVRKLYEKNERYESIFSNLKPFLSSGDLLFGNFETPFVKNSSSSQLFAGDPAAISVLKSTGFNVLHLANNHIVDYGAAGLRDTMELLKFNEIIPLGVGQTKEEAKRLVITDLSGIRLGWLGCGRTNIDQDSASPVFWEFDEQELIAEVKAAETQVDVLIVSIHTGLMYLDYPKPSLKSYAEKLFEVGANLILMHHAHVLQSVQVQQDGNICCYNLGNFLWDWQEGNVKIPIMQKEQNESAVFVFDIGKEGVFQATAIPIYMDEHFVIQWADHHRGQDILDRLMTISKDIQNDYTDLYENQRAQRNAAPIIKVVLFHLREGNWGYIREQLTHIRLEHIKMFWGYFSHLIFGKH